MLLSNLTQIVLYGLTVGSVLALVALGYSLVFSTTRIVNFAHGSMLVVAGYLTFVLVRQGLNEADGFMISEGRSDSNRRCEAWWRVVASLGSWNSGWVSAGFALLAGVFGEEL